MSGLTAKQKKRRDRLAKTHAAREALIYRVTPPLTLDEVFGSHEKHVADAERKAREREVELNQQRHWRATSVKRGILAKRRLLKTKGRDD